MGAAGTAGAAGAAGAAGGATLRSWQGAGGCSGVGGWQVFFFFASDLGVSLWLTGRSWLVWEDFRLSGGDTSFSFFLGSSCGPSLAFLLRGSLVASFCLFFGGSCDVSVSSVMCPLLILCSGTTGISLVSFGSSTGRNLLAATSATFLGGSATSWMTPFFSFSLGGVIFTVVFW
ncbi:hypothetical protein AAG570_003619 [Ranatra chinensis]|uniref:Secreted protein n=1 Tax=Ranatra chinensis TaxID=642074 RepID=A0ABD0Y5D6_9HEMI